jgi:hypothetical protein
MKNFLRVLVCLILGYILNSCEDRPKVASLTSPKFTQNFNLVVNNEIGCTLTNSNLLDFEVDITIYNYNGNIDEEYLSEAILDLDNMILTVDVPSDGYFMITLRLELICDDCCGKSMNPNISTICNENKGIPVFEGIKFQSQNFSNSLLKINWKFCKCKCI